MLANERTRSTGPKAAMKSFLTLQWFCPTFHKTLTTGQVTLTAVARGPQTMQTIWGNPTQTMSNWAPQKRSSSLCPRPGRGLLPREKEAIQDAP